MLLSQLSVDKVLPNSVIERSMFFISKYIIDVHHCLLKLCDMNSRIKICIITIREVIEEQFG